jgi:Cgr1 family
VHLYRLPTILKHQVTNGFTYLRRSNLPVGVKSKSWEDRKRKDTQLAAIKALAKEMKDEKEAEIAR